MVSAGNRARLAKGRATRTRIPIVMDLRSEWPQRLARATVLRAVYRSSPWLHLIGQRRIPPTFEKHLKISHRQLIPAAITWAAHQQWRAFSQRLPVAETRRREMQLCTPAGVVMATPKYMTCDRARLCPWCHQRTVATFLAELPKCGSGELLAATVFGFRPVSKLFPSELELYRTALLVDKLRRVMRGAPLRVLKTLKYFPAGEHSAAWGVRTLVVTRIRAGSTLPRTVENRGLLRGVSWHLAGSPRELAGKILPFMSYPVKLLDPELPQTEVDQLFHLSKAVRNSKSRPARALQLLTPDQLLSSDIMEILYEQIAISSDERRPLEASDLVVHSGGAR